MELIPQTFECPRDAYQSNAILLGINPHSYLGLSIPAFSPCSTLWDSLVAQTVKHLPAMREIHVQPLGRKDPLEKEMATHYSTLAWRIPWTEERDRLQSMDL